MASTSLKALVRPICIALGLVVFSADARAQLSMQINELASGGIRFSWNGSGNFGGTGNLGNVVDIRNADMSFVDADLDLMAIAPAIDFSNLAFEVDGTQVTAYTDVAFDDQVGGDDFSFNPDGIGSISNSGQAWSASGFFETTPAQLAFSQFTPGDYTFATDVGDADAFGGATLNINRIPEPTSSLLCALLTLCAIGCKRCIVK